MTNGFRALRLAAVSIALSALLAPAASAECVRRIYNRSGVVLVAHQDEGPPMTMLPGETATIVMARPGVVRLAAYCTPGPNATPLAADAFDYEAVLDRCFYRFGADAFVPELGRGFLGLQGTAPFTLNNPRQGDLVLGPLKASCPVISRGG